MSTRSTPTTTSSAIPDRRRDGANRTQNGDECPEPHGADDCLVSGRLVRYTAECTTPSIHAVARRKPLVEELVPAILLALDRRPRSSAPKARSTRAAATAPASTTPTTVSSVRPPTHAATRGEGGAAACPGPAHRRLTPRTQRTLSASIPKPAPAWPTTPYPPAPTRTRDGSSPTASATRSASRSIPDGAKCILANVGWTTSRRSISFPAAGHPLQLRLALLRGPGPRQYSVSNCRSAKSLYEAPWASPPFFLYRHGSPVTPEDECRSTSARRCRESLSTRVKITRRLQRGALLRRLGPWLHLRDVPRPNGRPDPTRRPTSARSRHLSRRRPDDRPRRGPLLREALRLNRGGTIPPNQLRPRCPGRPPGRRSPLGRRRAAGSPPRRQRIDQPTGRRTHLRLGPR